MSDALSLFLAGIVSNYEKPAPEVTETVIGVSMTGEKQKLVRYSKKGAAALAMAQANTVKVEAAKAKVWIDAPAFTAAILAAGKTEAGNTDPLKKKTDEIKALDAYVGYKYGEPHGSQLDNAMRKARTAINGTVVEAPKLAKDIAGFVAGLPDNGKRETNNLAGRLQASVEAALDLRKQIERLNDGDPKALQLGMMLQLEQERAAALRKDLGLL